MYQYRLASSQVRGCIREQGMIVRLGPLMKMAFDNLKKGTFSTEREGRWCVFHGLPLSMRSQAMIILQKDGADHSSRTDESIRPAYLLGT